MQAQSWSIMSILLVHRARNPGAATSAVGVDEKGRGTSACVMREMLVQLNCELIDLGRKLSALILDPKAKPIHAHSKPIDPGIQASAERVDASAERVDTVT